MKTRILASLFFISFFFCNAALAPQPRVEVFSPQGVVKGVRQVRVKFSDQMVPIGDIRLLDPFEIECSEEGKGRWADNRNWTYDFEKNLPAGVICRFSLKPEIKTLSGKSLRGRKVFTFSTGGPKVIRSYPYEGAHIDESQAFVLTLDAEAKEESIITNVWCAVEGINERIGIRILKGETREKLLKAYASRRYRWRKDGPEVVCQCKQSFPNNKKVRLIWGKGVTSESGVSTERDQVLHFKSRGPFTAKFECTRENTEAGCIPFKPMNLKFTAPVPWKEASKIVLKNRSKVYAPEREDKRREFVYHVSFPGPFPEADVFTIEIPDSLKDDAGRVLSNKDKFPLSIKTGPFPPLAKFSSRYGIIEKADPLLPVTIRSIEPDVKSRMVSMDSGKGLFERIREKLTGRVRKIETDEEIIKWLRQVASVGRKRSLLKQEKRAKTFKLPKSGSPSEFEVVGIPLKKTGLHVVEIESEILGRALLGKERPMYVHTAALVTNLSAHFKWGRESSLVWVTTLDKAQPVKDVAVTIRNCKGEIIWEGTTDRRGIAYIDRQLPSADKLPYCRIKRDKEAYLDNPQLGALSGLGRGLFVFARTSDDMTFVHSSWNDGIEPWRFQLPGPSYLGPVIAHTVLDRSLFRAGETVHMKHFIRRHTMPGFSLLDQKTLPRGVGIRHLGSDQTYEFPIKWDVTNGVTETSWKIPRRAKLGHYQVVFLKKMPKKDQNRGYYYGNYWKSGSFRVEEFRVPLMRGSIKPVSESLINVTEADVDLLVTYLSGGGAEGLPVKLRTRLEPKHISFEDYERFRFEQGALKEGIVRRHGPETRHKEKILTYEFVLEKGGAKRAKITGIPKLDRTKNILAEMEYRDPNGESQSVSKQINLWPSKLLLGIKPDSWAMSKENFKFQVVALDLKGKPVSGVPIKIDILKRDWYSHRKRLLGGFYSYEHVTEIKRIGRVYEGVTDKNGLLFCDAKSPVSGNVILEARTVDDSGNLSVSNSTMWVAGKDDWWFDVSDHDRIDLVPEKKRYEPGETAVFQLRMPFRKATVLVAMEREGILDTYIKEISGKTPVIKIPVKGNYAPNVFVSALCVRGRVSGIKPAATVDLGKPAYKIGITGINVGLKAHELKVKVTTPKDVYRIREKVPVEIAVSRADGKDLGPEGEAAIAVVDEGLLELAPNPSWRLLESMMKKRGYEVETATAQMQVVGKRHYGLKALPAGGGGGRRTTRELFDTLLFWKARVPLDKKGGAIVEVPLGDSLTSFRIVAVASSGRSFFGTGHKSIRTTQDLQLISGLSQVLRQGDRFKAGFTVRNASKKAMNVKVSASIETGKGTEELETLVMRLAAGKAQETGWLIDVPQGVDSLKWVVVAEEEGGPSQDALRVKQKVVEVTPVRVFQATLFQLEGAHSKTIKPPEDAQKGRGGIRISLRPRLTDDQKGILEYMKRYPYTCLEQKVSKAIVLGDDALWNKVMDELPSYLDGNGLAKYFPSCRSGSDVLTAYLLSIAAEAGLDIPWQVKNRMTGGLKGFVEGRIIRYSSLPTADLSIRKMAALEALSRHIKMKPALLDSITIEPNLWPTSAVIDWLNVLVRIPGIHGRARKLKKAQQIIHSRLDFQGTTLVFSTENSDFLWWLMVSADVNAGRIVLSLLDFKDWKEDMPRLIRGAVGRQKRGRWSTTVANAWGMLALKKFSRKFEAIPVAGISKAAFLDAEKEVKWTASPKGKTLIFPWREGENDLDFTHEGEGSPWVTLQSLAAIALKEPLSSGYKIKKTLIPVDRKRKEKWSRGDVVRIRLELEAQADMTWVVVKDPIPAGASILGTGLGRDSRILTSGEKQKGWAWPVFKERSFEEFRAYYDYVPKGKWTVEYTIRLNNEGLFNLPETRVEALYAPEMFGEIPNGRVNIHP